MPGDCSGEQCHKHLRPPVLIYHSKDAVADGEPDQSGGIDFDTQGNCAVNFKVTDILAEDAMVYKPIMETSRRAQPQRRSKQKQGRSGQQRQEYSRHGKAKTD